MFVRLSTLLGALAFTTATAFAAPPQMQLPPQPKVRPAGIPTGYVLVTPCVAGMGEHWANLKDLSAPIYGSYQGQAIFTEVMVPKSVLDKGFAVSDLKALPGHTIDHLAIEYHPHGHEGMPVPHYDFHLYYVPAAQVAAMCPNGIPDPDAAAARK